MIEARDGRFYDPAGREVILHGLNYVNKDPKSGYLHPGSGSAFADFRRWGFNCIRFGVIWDGLEPKPGRYNEAYLEAIFNLSRRNKSARSRDIAESLGVHKSTVTAAL